MVNYDDASFPSYIYDGYVYSGCTWEKVPHFHKDIELLSVHSSCMGYSVNGTGIFLEKGDTIFVNSDQLHYSYAMPPREGRYIIAVLHPRILCSNFAVEAKAVLPVISNKKVPYILFKNGDRDAARIQEVYKGDRGRFSVSLNGEIMRPVNIYALTRITEPDDIMRLERQMSDRESFMKVKTWEVDDLKLFSEKLMEVNLDPSALVFYYSFVMPKLGKEFDLLRIGREYVINVELKSRTVRGEAVRKQLAQNRHYLLALGKSVYSYTFLKESGQLVRLSNSGRLVNADWEELAGIIEKQGSCFCDDIEMLFREDRYLISPLTDPGRFLRQEYFLTWQQTDIKKKMLDKIRESSLTSENPVIQGFTGYPGTGKTLLLYDMAMELSKKDRVCILHFGSHEKELEELDERLKRIDYYYCEGDNEVKTARAYNYIFVDEGHRIRKRSLETIVRLSLEWRAPVIVSYDREDDIHPSEREFEGAGLLESLPGYIGYFLTNRIRLNSELSTFIRRIVHPGAGNHRRHYRSVSLYYSGSEDETFRLLALLRHEKFFFIYDEDFTGDQAVKRFDEIIPCIGAMEATCKEYEKVVMKIDGGFCYDGSGYLRCESVDPDGRPFHGRVRKLFHGLSRAKENIAVIVESNPEVFRALLSVLQPE